MRRVMSVSMTGRDRVVTYATEDTVISDAALNIVVASPARQYVIGKTPDQGVVTIFAI